MVYTVRPLIATISCFIFCLWWFGVNNQSTIEVLYSKDDFSQDMAKIYMDLALTSKKRGDWQAASTAFKNILSYVPNHLDALDELGQIYEQQKNLNAALTTYFQAMHINPNFIEIRVCPQVKVTSFAADRTQLTNKPAWRGEALHGKTIYVFAEKGLGDTLCFSRFLPLLVAQGAKVLFKPQKHLTSLIIQSNLGVEIIDAQVDPLTLNFDFHTSLLSLPFLLNITYDTMPQSHAYLISDAQKVEKLKPLFNTNKLKIGIVWQGDKNHANDKNRSIPLSFFYPLFKIPNIQWYSLQKGFGVEQLADAQKQGFSIIDLDTYINDFTDTAALMQNLDLVISIDTAAIHLAGALGKSVWMLIPNIIDWRWLVLGEGINSVWYSSLTKYRQPKQGEWKSVFKAVHQKLIDLLKKKPT